MLAQLRKLVLIETLLDDLDGFLDDVEAHVLALGAGANMLGGKTARSLHFSSRHLLPSQRPGLSVLVGEGAVEEGGRVFDKVEEIGRLIEVVIEDLRQVEERGLLVPVGVLRLYEYVIICFLAHGTTSFSLHFS